MERKKEKLLGIKVMPLISVLMLEHGALVLIIVFPQALKKVSLKQRLNLVKKLLTIHIQEAYVV